MQLTTVNFILLWLVVLINLFLTLAIIRRLNQGRGEPIETLHNGQPAPDFSAETLTGEPVTLAHYAGRNLMFVFVSPTCGYCRQYIAELESSKHHNQGSGIEVILVSDSDKAAAQAYVQELAITFPVISAPRSANAFFDDYRIGGVPFYVMIDPDRKVRSSGVLSAPQWRELSNSWGKENL